MPRITRSWVPVAGESPAAHRLHAGKVAGLPTHVSSDFLMPATSGYIDVPDVDWYYVYVAPVAANGDEGIRSAAAYVYASEGGAPVGVLTLTVEDR